MIDIYIGRTPAPIQHEMKLHTLEEVREALRHVREVFRVHRNKQTDRRKNTRDRRRQENEGVIVRLSNRPERRTRPDRRQRLEPLNSGKTTPSEPKQELPARKKPNDIAVV